MIPNILGDIEFHIIEPKPEDSFQEALIVDVSGGKVVITMNGHKAYRLLAQRNLVVAGLNKKLEELVQRKLEQLALQEEQTEKDR